MDKFDAIQAILEEPVTPEEEAEPVDSVILSVEEDGLPINVSPEVIENSIEEITEEVRFPVIKHLEAA